LLTVAVIDCGDVLRCSLSKYNQDVFSFVFRSKDEIIEEPGRCTAAILDQNGQTIESVMILASSIFAQNSCPIIVIASQEESLPEALLDSALEQGLFLFLKKPVYIPILMKALDRLIQQGKGWAGDRVTEDTRQFYLQAVLHEEI
jgi:DNA-binding NtrC family response regulator